MDPLFIGEEIAETTEAVGHLVSIVSVSSMTRASSSYQEATKNKFKKQISKGPLTVSYGHMFCAA